MVHHIVMWDVPDQYEMYSKEKLLIKIKQLLESLPPVIPELQSLTVGINQKVSEYCADIVLMTSFNSWDDFENYRVHPQHQEAAGFIGKAVIARKVVDFEL